MTTATPSAIRKRTAQQRLGFTMVEVMVSAALSVVIMTGVLSTTLAITRSGLNAANYNDMEQEARLGLELFARDVRMAKKITWSSPSKVTLAVVSDSAGNTVDHVYEYKPDQGTFTRSYSGTTDTLFTHIVPVAGWNPLKGFNIKGDEITASDISSAPSLASTNTKELQLNLTCSRSINTSATATNRVVSARFILRNKLVTSK